jgi:hypothetical protein
MDWFMFETRIRSVVSEMITPTIKRQDNLREQMKNQIISVENVAYEQERLGLQMTELTM